MSALISIVIPVYKSVESLRPLHQRLVTAVKKIGLNYEIILIDDRSPDDAWREIVSLANEDPGVIGIRLSRNFGQHNAITAGLDKARGAWIVVMDCDLQDRPEEIPAMYAKALQGFDVVLARRGRRRDTLKKRSASFLFYKVFNLLTGWHYDHEVANFRLFSRKVSEAVRCMREQVRFFGGMMEWVGFNVASINVTHGERYEGDSAYNLKSLFRLAGRFVIAHSQRPLNTIILLGCSVSIFAFLFAVWIVARALIWASIVPGWASIIASIYFIGGLILASIGIVGMYIGKIFDEVRGRPIYVLDEVFCKRDSYEQV